MNRGMTKKLSVETGSVRAIVRGSMAVIALLSTTALLLKNGTALPTEWWIVVSSIVAFYFGGEKQ